MKKARPVQVKRSAFVLLPVVGHVKRSLQCNQPVADCSQAGVGYTCQIGGTYTCIAGNKAVMQLHAGYDWPCPTCGCRITKATFVHCDVRAGVPLGKVCAAVGYLSGQHAKE